MGVYCAQTWKPLMIYQTPPPHSAWSPLATNFWRLSNINVCETHIFIYCSVSIKYHMTLSKLSLETLNNNMVCPMVNDQSTIYGHTNRPGVSTSSTAGPISRELHFQRFCDYLLGVLQLSQPCISSTKVSTWKKNCESESCRFNFFVLWLRN